MLIILDKINIKEIFKRRPPFTLFPKKYIMVTRFVYIIYVTKVHINLFMVKCSMLLFLHINYTI